MAMAASGGKDSTVLAHVLTTLNKRHNYGLDLFLLSIDEGISGYRDDSLETVKRNEQQYQGKGVQVCLLYQLCPEDSLTEVFLPPPSLEIPQYPFMWSPIRIYMVGLWTRSLHRWG